MFIYIALPVLLLLQFKVASYISHVVTNIKSSLKMQSLDEIKLNNTLGHGS